MKAPKTQHRVHVILSLEEYEQLRAKQRETGASVSEIIRRAIASAVKLTKGRAVA